MAHGALFSLLGGFNYSVPLGDRFAILYRSYEIAVVSLSNSYPAGKILGHESSRLPTDASHPNIRT